MTQLEFDFFGNEVLELAKNPTCETLLSFGMSYIPLDDVAAILEIAPSELQAMLDSDPKLKSSYNKGKAIAKARVFQRVQESTSPLVLTALMRSMLKMDGETDTELNKLLNITGKQLSEMYQDN